MEGRKRRRGFRTLVVPSLLPTNHHPALLLLLRLLASLRFIGSTTPLRSTRQAPAQSLCVSQQAQFDTVSRSLVLV